MRCSDCHVMHFSQSHGYGPNGSGVVRSLGFQAEPGLLRASVNDLCTSCHDGDVLATDVLDQENTGSQLGIVRTAGYLARDGFSSGQHGGHRLDSFDVAPGSNPSWSAASENRPGVGLTCVNCHDPHGAVGNNHPTGSQYRNLRSDPGFSSGRWVTYNATPGANDLTRDVFVRQARSYDESQMDWNEPDSQRSAIARWCLGCHTDMHSDSGFTVFASASSTKSATTALDEHPYEDEDLEDEMITQINSLGNRVKVLSSFGIWSPIGSDATPTCVTCHRAHGNGNPYGLIYRSGTGIPTENGDTNGTSVTDLCNQCHPGGSPFTH
ncbi:MAG: hypothetical protein L6Q99_14845 [Planctomycetes bacterium]|nr:hypothetical protein [Planctomycetota bacterium]